MVPASVNDQYVIRFCAVAQNSTEDDIGKLLLLFATVFLISELLKKLIGTYPKFTPLQ